MILHVLSPGDPGQRTGGYLYNACVVEAWRSWGHDVRVHPIDGIWPLPGGSGGLPEVREGELVLADGLLWTGLGERRAALTAARVTVLVHLALHEGGGLTPQDRAARRALEAEALDGADAVVATGRPTLEALDRPGVVLLPPGHDCAAITAGERGHILTVASVTPRKGFVDLLRLLEGLSGDWTWSVAGSLERDPEHGQWLRRAIEDRGWGERVTLYGELDQDAMEAAYARASILLQAAHHEPYGMAIQEAAARGIPVVTRPAGAVVDLPEGGYTVFDTVDEGRDALGRMLMDSGSARAALAKVRFPTWAETARRLLEVMHG